MLFSDVLNCANPSLHKKKYVYAQSLSALKVYEWPQLCLR